MAYPRMRKDEKELISMYTFHTKDDDVEKQMKTFSEFSFKSHDSIFSRV